MKQKQTPALSCITAWKTAVLLVFCACIACGSAAKEKEQEKETALLFSFFRGNGESGLYLAWSKDGLRWTELTPPGASFLKPTVGGKLMRDPSLALGPDGTFHMVWTTSWGRPPAFGYASSRDLVNWSEQKAVEVMEDDPGTQNVWAPEIFYDAPKEQWIIYWASTVPVKFEETKHSGDNNHRIYCTTTQDFVSFTPTRLFYDGGFNVIDAVILPAKGKYYLIVKDETKNPVKKNLRIAEGRSAEGPFGPAGEPFTISWIEGPSPMKVGNDYIIYFDHYGSPQYYGALRSSDLKKWEDITKEISMPKGARHGTALRVPLRYIEELQNTNSTIQPKQR
jgi:hypothetical protein